MERLALLRTVLVYVDDSFSLCRRHDLYDVDYGQCIVLILDYFLSQK